MRESKTKSHDNESEIIIFSFSSKLVIVISEVTDIIKQITYM
jgi:hypothetical protein